MEKIQEKSKYSTSGVRSTVYHYR